MSCSLLVYNDGSKISRVSTPGDDILIDSLSETSLTWVIYFSRASPYAGHSARKCWRFSGAPLQSLHDQPDVDWILPCYSVVCIVPVSRRHLSWALLLSNTLSLTVAHTGCTCPIRILTELMYFSVGLPWISSLQFSSTCLLIALSTTDFHFSLDGGLSMSSEGDGRPYRLRITQILLNQELSFGVFIASCRRLISLSIPLLVIHLQKRPSIFLCRTHSTGGIPSRTKDADECVLSGKCCICFNDFLWYCSSWLISDCFSSWTSSPYRSLRITYVDHNFPLTLNPFILWKPAPSVNMQFSYLGWFYPEYWVLTGISKYGKMFCLFFLLNLVITHGVHNVFWFLWTVLCVSTQLFVGWMPYLFVLA